jgi:CRISPR-associated protein (TIGR02584 family)
MPRPQPLHGSAPRAAGRDPAPRRVLAVCLAGLSPAVVTEALYALITRRPLAVVPWAVHVVTTHAAYPRVVGQLLGPTGGLARLREQCRLATGTLRCTPREVHVLADSAGRPLDDIRTPEDSRAAGEFIGRLVHELAGDSGVELHCSLAGGRKTMSALLATALQLHGRPGDRLYHVLVNEPFERIPNFLFPLRPPVRYRVDGRIVDSRRARIELAEVPFVRLGAAARRLGYDQLALERVAAELEAEALGRLVPEPLSLDLPHRTARIGDQVLRLPPLELTLYAVYAQSRSACSAPACRGGGRCARCHLEDTEVVERRGQLLELYRATQRGETRDWPEVLREDPADASGVFAFRAWLEQTRSRVNRALRAAFGPGPRGQRYAIAPMDASANGRRRRGLGLPPAFVRVMGLGPGEGAQA